MSEATIFPHLHFYLDLGGSRFARAQVHGIAKQLKESLPSVDYLCFVDGSTCVFGTCTWFDVLNNVNQMSTWQFDGYGDEKLKVELVHLMPIQDVSEKHNYLLIARKNAKNIRQINEIMLSLHPRVLTYQGSEIKTASSTTDEFITSPMRVTKIKAITDLKIQVITECAKLEPTVPLNNRLIPVLDLVFDCLTRERRIPVPTAIDIDDGNGNPIVEWSWENNCLKHVVTLFMRDSDVSITHSSMSTVVATFFNHQLTESVIVADFNTGKIEERANLIVSFLHITFDSLKIR
jgi:hypothetical protein